MDIGLNEVETTGIQIGLSDCCHEPIVDNNHFCSSCGDVPCYLICEDCMDEGCVSCNDTGRKYHKDFPDAFICSECEGTGEVEILDQENVREWTITPPYKKITCETCGGGGGVENGGRL